LRVGRIVWVICGVEKWKVWRVLRKNERVGSRERVRLEARKRENRAVNVCD
jgi:hypothetical protein